MEQRFATSEELATLRSFALGELSVADFLRAMSDALHFEVLSTSRILSEHLLFREPGVRLELTDLESAAGRVRDSRPEDLSLWATILLLCDQYVWDEDDGGEGISDFLNQISLPQLFQR